MTATPRTPADPAKDTELKLAWREAETALNRFKTSRDPADRERAADRLYQVMLVEAGIVIRARVRVDSKLSPRFRRNKAEMAREAVDSVFSNDGMRMSALAEQSGSLRAYPRCARCAAIGRQ